MADDAVGAGGPGARGTEPVERVPAAGQMSQNDRDEPGGNPGHTSDPPRETVPPGPRETVPRGQRTRFTGKRDWVVAGVLVVALAASAVVLWQTGDLAATTRAPAAEPGAVQEPPLQFPPSLAETWRADSPMTPVPVVAGAVVATGSGGEVVGRDPLTGEVEWRYARDRALCTVAPFDTAPPQRTDSGTVLALYASDGGALPDDDPYAEGGCSEVTGLDGTSGKVERTRNSDAEFGTRLLSDGSTVTTTGRRLLTSWRSDLVMTSQYGTRPTPVQFRSNLRHGCTFGSVAVTPGKIGVIERCPEDNGADRLTVYRSQSPSGKDNDDVEVVSSTVVGARARIVALTDTHTAVALADPARLRVYTSAGIALADYPLDEPGPGEPANTDPPGATVLTTTGPEGVYWFTGSRTVALSPADLRPMWTIQTTLGPGVVHAGRLVVPIQNGLAVQDETTGANVGVIPVDRGGYTGPITMSATGEIVLEQRGPTLVALR